MNRQQRRATAREQEEGLRGKGPKTLGERVKDLELFAGQMYGAYQELLEFLKQRGVVDDAAEKTPAGIILPGRGSVPPGLPKPLTGRDVEEMVRRGEGGPAAVRAR